MVDDPKKDLSPLPAGKYGKSRKHSTWRCHQANTGKSGLEAERIRVLGALCSIRSKKKLVAEKRREMHFLSNEEREKWIEDYVERETAVARQQVQDAETAVMQQQQNMGNVEKGQSTTTKPQITFEKMLNAIGDGLSDLASSEDEEDAEDEDDDEEGTGHGKLSEDDEPGCVMGTISKRYSTAWRACSRSRWGLTNWHNQDGRCGRLLAWEIYEVRDNWIEGSGCWEAPNRLDCSHTIIDNIWRAYAGDWYRPRTIRNATSDVLTWK